MRHKIEIDKILNMPEHETTAKQRALMFRNGEEMQLRIFDFMAIVQNPGQFTDSDCIRVLNEMVEFETEMHDYFKQLREYMLEWRIQDE